MILYYLIIALMGYLFGCSNLAFFLGKARGFDIRTYGSNNAGASNATVTMGLKIGILVGIHDIAKSCLAALAAQFLFPDIAGAAAIAGVAAVLGHIFPFYLRFQGGKGFASFIGLTLALDWRYFLAIIVVVALIMLISDYIVPGTLTTIISFPVYLAFMVETGKWITIGAVCVASLIILIKHFENIKRLVKGEEIGFRRAMSKKDKISKQ